MTAVFATMEREEACSHQRPKFPEVLSVPVVAASWIRSRRQCGPPAAKIFAIISVKHGATGMVANNVTASCYPCALDGPRSYSLFLRSFDGFHLQKQI